MAEKIASDACDAASEGGDRTTGEQIADGHAGSKHIDDLDVDSVEDLADLINGIIHNPDDSKAHPSVEGKRAYWSNDGVLVIEDPTTTDGGSVYRPDRGKGYFDDLWK